MRSPFNQNRSTSFPKAVLLTHRNMRVTGDGFARMGEMIGRIRRPTVIVQEGGYPSPVPGQNLVRFIEGFRAASGA